MTEFQYVLLFMIIHLICVLHIFDVFRRFGYEPGKDEKILIWVCAPEIMFMILLLMIFKGGKK